MVKSKKTNTQRTIKLKSYKGFTVAKFVYKSTSGVSRVDYQAHNRDGKTFYASTLPALRKMINTYKGG